MRRTWIGLLLALFVLGCGKTFVVRLPDSPALPFSKRSKAGARDQRVKCQFMSILIDFSRHGEATIGARVAQAMAEEFEKLGTTVTSSHGKAYWSLMILASDNSRRDGYIFSALLSARNMNEGYDPGVTVFTENSAPDLAGRTDKIPTLYNGLSYGPYDALEDQSRQYVRQAYAAVFPYAKRLCDFAAADEEREQSLDAQLPGAPEPL